jgi:methionyl-tRNA synthetase
LNNGKCPNHPNYVIDEVEEENYFFALSEFRTDLLKLLLRRSGPAGEQGPTLEILPESRFNEVMSLLREPLEDISISRMNKGWGIPIPWDREQVIYVWFDALLNYLTGVGFGTDHEMFQKWWPADCHLIGKDITRFHCILFPAMILAYNAAFDDGTELAMPKKVYSHGFLYEKKHEKMGKISKSSGGGVGTISQLLDDYGPDAYRYYFLAKCRYHDDSEFSRDDFLNVYNADLANNLGNMVSRVNAMIHKYFDGSLPVVQIPPHRSIRWVAESTLNHYRKHMDAFEYHYALQYVWGILDRCNEYIDREKPWILAKDESQKGTDRLAVVLRNCVSCLRVVSILLQPLLPQSSDEIYGTFFPFRCHSKNPDTAGDWPNLDWEYLNSMYDHEDLEHMSMGMIITFDKITLFPRVKE